MLEISDIKSTNSNQAENTSFLVSVCVPSENLKCKPIRGMSCNFKCGIETCYLEEEIEMHLTVISVFHYTVINSFGPHYVNVTSRRIHNENDPVVMVH